MKPSTLRPTLPLRAAALLFAGSVLLFPSYSLAKQAKPRPLETEPQATLATAFVTVNGEAQSNARAEILLREQIARGAPDSPEMRAAVRQTLITQLLMMQEARKAGLDKNPLLQAQIELTQNNLLAQAWQQKVLADNPPKDAEIKAEYERQLAGLGDTDYRLRHVLVKDEASAKGLLEKIRGGAKLADLALENSLDAATRERGGLSDWTNTAMLMPALSETLKSLSNGQVASQSVKTEAGWHVLQREESRPFQAMSFEQAKPQMQAVIARRMLDAKVQLLINQAKVK